MSMEATRRVFVQGHLAKLKALTQVPKNKAVQLEAKDLKSSADLKSPDGPISDELRELLELHPLGEGAFEMGNR